MYGRDSGFKVKRSNVTEGPEVEPIDLLVAKAALKVEHDEEDSLIALLLQAAREDVEERTGLSLITQTRVMKLDCFPYCDTITLTHGPVQEITSVKYQDANDAEQTLEASTYWTDVASSPARIQIKNTWPTTKTRHNAVEVTYVAGFGDSGSDVPGRLKEAILVVLAYLYENRDQPVPHNLVDSLIGSYVSVQDVSY